MTRRMYPAHRVVAALVAALLAAACAQMDVAPPHQDLRPGDAVDVRGQTTDEGVECPAVRGEDGTLYTLAGAPAWVAPGQEVVIRGTIAETAICQQGITISVTHMERRS